MRLRITLTLFALLALALTFAGTVSLLLVRHAQSDTAQQQLLDQVRTLAANPQAAQDYLPLFQQVAGFTSAGSLVVFPDGRVSPPPPNALLTAEDARDLYKGTAIVTAHNHVAVAAAPIAHGRVNNTVLALYLEDRLNFSTDNIWYFLIAGGVSLLVAAVVASAISQRLAHRVGAVANAARRIATGDLATRVTGRGLRAYPELRELDTSINTMAANLERAEQAERDFLLAISHEFRTPLTSIRGYAEAIAEGAVSDPPSAAAVVVSESDRLGRLIGDLLDLARLRTRHFALDFGRIDVVSVVEQVAEAQRYSIAGDGLELEVDLPEERILVEADYHRLGQIVSNLVENAQKFAHHRVGLSVDADESSVVIVVRDDGPGISEADLPFIFDRLFRSDRHPGRRSGSGLGLAIVSELTAAMQATITVNSPLGSDGGTEMAVRFSRAPDEEERPGQSLERGRAPHR